MKRDLQSIRERMPALFQGIEETLYAAAGEVRALKRTGSGDYADAILDQNGFGGDTAEIYFYRFASEDSPNPSEAGFRALMSDPERSRAYEEACYRRWSSDITAVQRVVRRYEGEITVNGMPLDNYFFEVEDSGVTPNHRVHVRILIAGQDALCQLRELVDTV